MKSFNTWALFAAGAAAHSAVTSVIFDSTTYPARNAIFDADFGAKRIEWKRKNIINFPWFAVSDVQDPMITCGLEASPPELKAVARAGSNITVQWSGIVQMHLGPVMTYLGPYTPGQKPQDIKFFKIKEAGYDKQAQEWANEYLIKHKTADPVQIPSDIKPGLYVLRTELLALHGNRMSSNPTLYSGPQFYTHCFNVEITGSGNAVPEGVTFPGGYKRTDPGVAFNLYNNRAAWNDYVIPGPPVYQGKHDAPVGEKPVVAQKDTGAFPEDFDIKYRNFAKKALEWSDRTFEAVNKADPRGGAAPKGGAASSGPPNLSGLLGNLPAQFAEAQTLNAEYNALKTEAKQRGLV